MDLALLGALATLGLAALAVFAAWRRASSLARRLAEQRGRFDLMVTEHRNAVEALRDQVKFSGDVFDALPIGLAMRDLEGRYVFVNRAWEKYTGARREDVIGKTVRDRAPQDEAERIEAEDRAALARGPGAPVELKDMVFG